MTDEEPPFRRIAIAGIGLIGGSIALAVRDRWPAVQVVGIDRPAVLAHAAGTGAIDRGLASITELEEADLVILAAPVRQNARLLSELPARVLDTALVTDVGGTKRDAVKAAGVVAPPLRFVGGHPLGGAEQGGGGPGGSSQGGAGQGGSGNEDCGIARDGIVKEVLCDPLRLCAFAVYPTQLP